MKTNLQILKAWIKAFNNHNIEGLLELYADKAVHLSEAGKKNSKYPDGILRKSDMRVWFPHVFSQLKDVKCEIDSTIDGEKKGGDATLEYHYTVNKNTEKVVMRFIIDEGKILASQVLK